MWLRRAVAQVVMVSRVPDAATRTHSGYPAAWGAGCRWAELPGACGGPRAWDRFTLDSEPSAPADGGAGSKGAAT